MAEVFLQKVLQQARNAGTIALRRSLYTDASQTSAMTLDAAPRNRISLDASQTLPYNEQRAASICLEDAPTQKTLQDMPGLDGWPVVGTLPEYFNKQNRGKIHELHRRRHARYGKIIREKLGPCTNVNLADPVLVEELLRQEGKYPFRPPYESWVEYNDMKQRKPGLMTATDEYWFRYRRIIGKRLSMQNVISESFSDINDVVTTLITRLRHDREKSGIDNVVKDVPNVCYHYALEGIASILLGNRLGCLENELHPNAQKFIDATALMLKTGHQMMVGAKLHRKWNTRWWQRHVRSWDTILDVARGFIDKKMLEIQQSVDSSPQADTHLAGAGFLGHFLGKTDLSIEEIYSNIPEIMSAGIDTISNTLSFALYLLSTNPEAQDKLHQEVMRVVGSGQCQPEHLQEMGYLKTIIKETLRLYPTVPINARVMQHDITLDGYLIPKGTCVLLSIYTMSRNSEYFPNPDSFIPERWDRTEKDDAAKSRHPFCSLPFGFGTRSCIGRRIAEMELYLALARIIQQFQLSPHSSLNLDVTVRTVMTPGENLNIIFTDR